MSDPALDPYGNYDSFDPLYVRIYISNIYSDASITHRMYNTCFCRDLQDEKK